MRSPRGSMLVAASATGSPRRSTGANHRRAPARASGGAAYGRCGREGERRARVEGCRVEKRTQDLRYLGAVRRFRSCGPIDDRFFHVLAHPLRRRDLPEIRRAEQLPDAGSGQGPMEEKGGRCWAFVDDGGGGSDVHGVAAGSKATPSPPRVRVRPLGGRGASR